ncbi:siderophore ABC transporter substrate-binding protein [Bacillus sp. PS06]|uniref:siderophore ABC transporter substrate-binding protein n=1 Tax=Bacillus sp. PS06 TaxID=2764176 RepID=UPI00177F23C3|nr:siderophore ABC transporter substrate-binding protein [Bacillus sp. PS06]MBD8070871.1 siderophore ABC transporter substrate-binding protein [Bacillus sp. PS06]
MKKFTLLLVTMLLVVFAAACGGTETANTDEATGSETAEAKTITLTHKLGEAKVEVNPKNVVVFDFGMLDSLDKLGVEVLGVPQANVPSYLSKYEDAKYENVGSLKEPDFEKIAEIDPGLIIISGRQAEQYEELSKIAPTLYIETDAANYMESFKGNMDLLAQIFDKQAEVDAEIAKIEEVVASLNEKATATGATGLIVLANEGNISAYGSKSRFGIIHDVFGLIPADENIEVSTHGQSVSFEYIVEMDPDYLFVIDRDSAVGDGAAAKELIENELVKKTKAYENDNIVYLNPDFWYLSGGGLISVGEMANEIEAGLK